MQECFTWCVSRNSFVSASLSEIGKFVDRTIDTLIDEKDDETFRSLSQTFFNTLEAPGKESVDDISKEKLKTAKKMIRTMPYIPKEKYVELLRFAAHLLVTGRQTAREQLRNI